LQVFLLFSATVIIWGSTWIAVKLHLGVVDPSVSAFYRNAIAALVMFAWCRARKLSLRFPLKDHFSFLLLGLFLFSGNYYLVYKATGMLTSGLVAVISTIVFFNILTARFILGNKTSAPALLGALVGVAGITLVFSAELTGISFADNSVRGLLLALLATFLASMGSITATWMSTRRQLPVVQYNAWGMFYGCCLLFLLALFSGKTFNYEYTLQYSAALIYLAVFGTALGFGFYLRLLELIGPDKGGYTFLIFPVVALLISTVFEAYEWTLSAFIGLGLIAAGSILALRSKTPAKLSAD